MRLIRGFFAFSFWFIFQIGFSQCYLSNTPSWGTPLSTTGSETLDKILISEKKNMEAEFGVTIYLSAFDDVANDSHKKNAFATRDYRVLLGKSLMLDELVKTGNTHSIIAVLAHEVAHCLQFYMKMTMDYKYPELHADFLAGWYMGNREYLASSDVSQVITSFYDKGDYGFYSPNHHGTPSERAKAMITGFYFSYLSIYDAYQTGISIVTDDGLNDLDLNEIWAYVLDNKFDDATNGLKTLIKRNPSDATYYVQLGIIYEQARSYDLAFESYNQSIKIDANYSPAYYRLGDLYYQYGDYANAYLNLDKYVKLTKDKDATVKRAKYRFLTKDYEGTIKDILDILATDPSDNILHRLLGYSYFETKNYIEALKHIEQFLNAAPARGEKIIPDDYRYYGKIIFANAKDSASAVPAIVQLKTALEMDSLKLDVYSSLADVYLKTKNYDQAIQILQRKIKLVKEPSTNDIFKIGQGFYIKAVTKNDSLIYLKADSCFAIVTTKSPELVSGHVFRARANAGLDPETKLGLAKIHYDAVVALGSLDAEKNKSFLKEAHHYLAYMYFLQKNKVKSLENIDKLLQFYPEDKNAKDLKKLIEELP